MAKRNRGTLKNYFRKGAMPSAENFADLVDSTVNQIEDGFAKPPETGFQLTALDQQHLLSFYQQNDPNSPLWSIGFKPQQDSLQIVAARQNSEQPGLALTPEGKMGIGTDSPQQTLEVNGTIAAKGRIGSTLISEDIPADGKWHDLTPSLEGCHMFEVVAGIGIRHTGRYALLRAIAINTCSPNRWKFWPWHKRNPIRVQQGYFHSRADELKLRWKQTVEHGDIRPYVLQIRSNTSYGPNRIIRYHLTSLWQDPYMQQCEVDALAKEPTDE